MERRSIENKIIQIYCYKMLKVFHLKKKKTNFEVNLKYASVFYQYHSTVTWSKTVVKLNLPLKSAVEVR